jgi:broad specificity phosphatase PhoE
MKVETETENRDSAAEAAAASPAGAVRESPTTLILVRHGETEGNVQQIWHGALDAPLTERGRLQVAATAERMAELSRRYPVDVFYVSPLPRAQSTAAAIARAIGMEPLVEPGLREFDLGDWEGRTFQDLRETENLWGRWAEDAAFAPPNGESPASFHRRVMQAMESLVARHPGQTVLAVSHGAVIGNALATLLGEGPHDWRRWDPPNCAISVLQWDGSRWRPVMANDISHLPPEAVATETPEY